MNKCKLYLYAYINRITQCKKTLTLASTRGQLESNHASLRDGSIMQPPWCKPNAHTARTGNIKQNNIKKSSPFVSPLVLEQQSSIWPSTASLQWWNGGAIAVPGRLHGIPVGGTVPYPGYYHEQGTSSTYSGSIRFLGYFVKGWASSSLVAFGEHSSMCNKLGCRERVYYTLSCVTRHVCTLGSWCIISRLNSALWYYCRSLSVLVLEI